jgi:hypothetical protein
MKNITNLTGFILITFFLLASAAFSCTGVTAANEQQVLVGNNEDYGAEYTDTVVRVRPAEDGKYGCLLVGFDRHNFSMGGINDQGLFFDMFTVPQVQWTSHPDKLNRDGFLEGIMLQECANVDEVIAFFQKYNHPEFQNLQVFVVDKTGLSAVISWGEGDIDAVKKQGDFQVVTNFFLLHTEWGWYPCSRYITAVEMMKDANEFSIDLFRTILDAVHSYSTSYSNICELRSGDMYVYLSRNFDEFIKLNIHEELQKGSNDYFLPDYFSEIDLISPLDNDVVSQSTVTFEWKGKYDSNYQLYYSTNPDFTDSQPIDVMGTSMRALKGTGAGLLCLGFLCFTIPFSTRKKPFIKFVIPLLAVILLVSCQTKNNGETVSPDNTFRVTIENLQSNTTYYWKVTANVTGNIITESIVQTFSTGGES